MAYLRANVEAVPPGAVDSWPNRDPLHELPRPAAVDFGLYKVRQSGGWQSAANVYAFCLNSPLAAVDPLGLASGDVLRMFAVFRNTMEKMCNNCNRIDFGWIGNYVALIPGSPMMGCYSQAEAMLNALDNSGPFKDWSIELNFRDVPPHNWVVAVPSDPSDPQVKMDTWYGCFTVKFPASPSADWEKCFACAPCTRMLTPVYRPH